MTDPDIKNLHRKIARAQKRREQKRHEAIMEYYRAIPVASYVQANPREPIGRVARFIERWAKKS